MLLLFWCTVVVAVVWQLAANSLSPESLSDRRSLPPRTSDCAVRVMVGVMVVMMVVMVVAAC